jgi:hypothetical protein
MKRVSIRFNGDVKHLYFIKLGSMDDPSPPERTFRGGDHVDVVLFERKDKPEAADLTFPDGVAAYEVPREFFTIRGDYATKKRWMWAGLLAIGVTSMSSVVVHSNRAAARQQKALASFSESFVLGLPRDETDRRCKQACLDNSGWNYDPNLEWLGAPVSRVRSPLTFGARNWVVYLVFEDDVVAAVLVRTEDWQRLRPIGSPQDRVRDSRAAWLPQFARN